MTQEEIIDLKKFCIERASIVCSNGDELANTATYLFEWVTERDNNQFCKEKEAVPYPDFLRKEEGDIATATTRVEVS